MSINAGRNNCQQLVADLTPLVQKAADEVATVLDAENTAQLGGDYRDIAVITPWLTSPNPILFLHAGEEKQVNKILIETGRSFGIDHTWYELSDTLTDQELAGDISTVQSIAYHALLSGTGERFVATAGAIQQKLPDPATYKQSMQTVTTGERMSLTDMAHVLVNLGYTRHRTSLEENSFRVKGELLEIRHALWPYSVTITVGGSTIERIVKTEDGRTSELKRMTILPVKFPTTTAPWSTATAHMLVIAPPASTIAGKKTIHVGGAEPQIQLSESTRALAADLVRCVAPKTETSFDRPLTYEQAFEIIGKLQINKPAVHADHGIGIFEGLQRRQITGITKEYLVLRYAQGDAISVPVEFAHKVTPYVGDTHPPIHRLHGTAWQKARKAAHVDAIAFAKELLTIAGGRADAERPPYTLSDSVEAELNRTFPHELTDDQVRTWMEVRSDLQQGIPMDRLVVGDVGFGKTEIAYRAARQVVANGKQVAILAPTTLLVQQHFDLFSDRYRGPVHLLSRFTSTTDLKKTKEAITSGEAHIVVGTHALLSPHLNWKNLGLIVVDEEQRFGVKQKEQLKKVRSAVDVLSLSATPIPRTLSMALAGLRSLSLITTAPPGRKSIRTFVGRLSEEKLRAAIEQELKRDGQVYIVAPKIRQLGTIERQVKALFPSITTAVAHARIPDEQLSAIIHRFDAGEVRILISSSIVEHGLDLPGANTMIVLHAPNFGLSELYQLRGRIGRRERQGYAYFFYDQHELSAIQRERLIALTEASRLGSGWELARRDLEIRGAGNLLGAEQSGSVNAVGVQLYLDMVRQVASGEAREREQAEVVLPFTTIIPTTYIEDADERTAWYVRLTRAQTTAELDKRAQALIKQFGPLPVEAEYLLLTLRLQRAATANGIQKIQTTKVSPPDEDPYDRIVIDTTNAPAILAKLAPLGNWRVRGTALTLDVDEVTPELVQRLIQLF